MATTYPFPTLWSALHGTSALAQLLPDRVDLLYLLDVFRLQTRPLFFPYIPESSTRHEVELFLVNFEHNAAVHPDKLALLFATLAQGILCTAYDRCGKEQTVGPTKTETQNGDLFVAAAMQSLRTASFMSRPTLHVIETLLMIGSYLAITGKLLDASSLFAITVRLAQGLGLHHNPSQIQPHLSPQEIDVRKRIWWWVLQVDQEYSMNLGQPLAISNIGDCPSPAPSSGRPMWPYLSDFTNQFTIISRQMLCDSALSIAEISGLTNELLRIQTTLPKSLQFVEQWLEDTPIPSEWPQKVASALHHSKLHYLLLLLNHRQRDDQAAAQSSAISTAGFVLHGTKRVREFCRSILQAYGFLNTRTYAAFFCWMASLQALTAAWTLLFSDLNTARDHEYIGLIQRTSSRLGRAPRSGLGSMIGEGVEKLGITMRRISQQSDVEPLNAQGRDVLLSEDPNLDGMLRFSLLPPSYRVSRSASLGGKSPFNETNGRARQEFPSGLPGKTKKPRKTDNKPSTDISVSKKKSAAKHSQSRTVQKGSSGVAKQDNAQQSSGIAEMAASPEQLLNFSEDLELSPAWSLLAIRNGPRNTSVASPPECLPDSNTAADYSAFIDKPNEAMNARMPGIMTTFQICNATQQKAELRKQVAKNFRSSSESFSDQSAGQFKFSPSYTQFPSPPQSHDSADSPESRQLCIPGTSQASAQFSSGRIPLFPAQSPYEHNFHDLLFGQQPASQLSEQSWQMQHSGYDN
ncbi:hypothetical protein MMC13_005105 [Lambiella insularis]|nr:hypothetical protein [Lambiella insularis]